MTSQLSIFNSTSYTLNKHQSQWWSITLITLLLIYNILIVINTSVFFNSFDGMYTTDICEVDFVPVVGRASSLIAVLSNVPVCIFYFLFFSVSEMIALKLPGFLGVVNQFQHQLSGFWFWFVFKRLKGIGCSGV